MIAHYVFHLVIQTGVIYFVTGFEAVTVLPKLYTYMITNVRLANRRADALMQ